MITNKCKEHSEEVKAELKRFFNERKTTLAILTNGRPDGERYVRNKVKVANELGVETRIYDVTNEHYDRVVCFIRNLKEDGIMVQMPFFDNPKLNDLLMRWIPEHKDVDGLNPLTKHFYGIYPATAQGIFNCFFKDTCLNVGVIGRSKLVGDPLVNLLMHSKNSVYVCHSQSKEHLRLLDLCDAIVSATGKPRFFINDGEWLNDDSYIELIVDVGIWVGKDGKLRGDVTKGLYDLPNVEITPVPGGVGLLTTTYLYWNLMQLKRHMIGEHYDFTKN